MANTTATKLTTATTREIKGGHVITGFDLENGTMYKFSSPLRVLGICITRDGVKHMHYRDNGMSRTEYATYEMEDDVTWEIEAK